MRVYSKSQGKVIDMPDTQTGGAGGGQLPTGGNDQLKAAFLLQMMKNPKQASNLMSVYKFMAPEEDKIAARQKEAMQTDFSQIPTILSELEKQQGQARGRATGLLARIKGAFGFQPDLSSYEAYRGAVATPIARTLFGEKGNLSDEDIKRAMGILPGGMDTPEEARRKITLIQQLAAAKAKGFGMDIPTTSSESEWE